MSSSIQFKRGTRAQIEALALKRGLLEGEPLFITDEARLAIALTSSTFQIIPNLQPPILFSAFLDAVSQPAQNTPFTAWTVIHNIGGGTYSSGAYTVPRTGWYVVHLHMLMDVTSTTAAGIRLRVNSTDLNRLFYTTGGSGLGYQAASGTEYLYLNSGDQLRVIQMFELGTWHGNASPQAVSRWNIEYKPWI